MARYFRLMTTGKVKVKSVNRSMKEGKLSMKTGIVKMADIVIFLIEKKVFILR